MKEAFPSPQVGILLLKFRLAAKGIKHFIRSPRPPPPPPTSGEDLKSHVRPKKTFGMPSTHSTALSFYFFYLVPALLFPAPIMTLFPFALPLRIILPTSVQMYIPDSAKAVTKLRARGAFRSAPIISTSRKLNLSDPQANLSTFWITAYWIGGVWSRVELGYHTYAQVWGGVAFGWLISSIWRGLWLYNPALEGWMQGWIDRIWALGLELVSRR